MSEPNPEDATRSQDTTRVPLEEVLRAAEQEAMRAAVELALFTNDPPLPNRIRTPRKPTA
jgi:hypothetical protein